MQNSYRYRHRKPQKKNQNYFHFLATIAISISTTCSCYVPQKDSKKLLHSILNFISLDIVVPMCSLCDYFPSINITVLSRFFPIRYYSAIWDSASDGECMKKVKSTTPLNVFAVNRSEDNVATTKGKQKALETSTYNDDKRAMLGKQVTHA